MTLSKLIKHSLFALLLGVGILGVGSVVGVVAATPTLCPAGRSAGDTCTGDQINATHEGQCALLSNKLYCVSSGDVTDPGKATIPAATGQLDCSAIARAGQTNPTKNGLSCGVANVFPLTAGKCLGFAGNPGTGADKYICVPATEYEKASCDRKIVGSSCLDVDGKVSSCEQQSAGLFCVKQKTANTTSCLTSQDVDTSGPTGQSKACQVLNPKSNTSKPGNCATVAGKTPSAASAIMCLVPFDYALSSCAGKKDQDDCVRQDGGKLISGACLQNKCFDRTIALGTDPAFACHGRDWGESCHFLDAQKKDLAGTCKRTCAGALCDFVSLVYEDLVCTTAPFDPNKAGDPNNPNPDPNAPPPDQVNIDTSKFDKDNPANALTKGQICEEFADRYLPQPPTKATNGNGIGVANEYYNTQKVNAKAARECRDCKNVVKNGFVNGATFYKLFNLGNFIPVVPQECVNQLPINLGIFVVMRVYSFIASLALSLIILALIIISVRWTVNGMGSKETYNIKSNVTNLTIALATILVISTLIFELLRAIGIDEKVLTIS
jgi:hypothetical protein